MRAVVQRVLNAGVTVDGECVGRIGRGYLVLLGVGHGDTRAEADRLWGKLRGLRINEDENGKTNGWFLTLVAKGVEHVAHGIFGGDMKVDLVNDGPFTIVLDTDSL